MTAFKSALLFVTVAAFQFIGAKAAALPTVFAYGHFTDRFGSHALPEMPVGDKVQIWAALDTNDPIGSPTISVEVRQGNATHTLDYIGPLYPIFENYHLYYKFIDFDPALTGPWEIVPTDSTGTGPSNFTNAMAEPEFLPLVDDIAVQGTPLGARVSWTLPNLTGFDVDGIFVRVIEAISGRHMWSTDFLPPQSTSFTPPPGVLQAGVDYVYWVSLADSDTEVTYLENSSKAFSQPFRFTGLSRDFNLDGTVDAADYVVWRNGLGTAYAQNDYGEWRANFGKTSGSGAAAYPLGASPQSLSAAVPEPATALLLSLSITALVFIPRQLRAGEVCY
jgi:hypothetical protein